MCIRDRCESLRKKGYVVHGEATGEKGLDVFERESPDLVILDVQLPGMDGWAVLEKIKTAPDRKVPVIMLTVEGGEREKLRGYIIGADYYIGKPFSIEMVATTVKELLGA